MKIKLVLSLVVLVGSLFAATFATPAFASGLCTQYHTVQRGETLFRIGLRYGVTTTTLQAWNYLPNPNIIYAGQSLCVQQQAPQPTYYTVQRGDWLSRIARQYGVDVRALANANGLTNPNRIYPGQVLIIPV